jgi:hypothetical protein
VTATRPKRAHYGRRERPDVKNLPPPWKRSLTESGMSRRTTPVEIVVVAAFIIVLVVVLVWGIQGAPT